MSRGAASQPQVQRVSPPADRRAQLLDDVVRGLADTPPQLPSKWFYDGRGSALFEQITQLPEYYPTRAETAILQAHADALAAAADADELVELGSGSSTKTRLLLAAMHRHRPGPTYVPLDVSETAVDGAAEALQADYPWLEVRGYVGDFEADLAALPRRGRRLLAFLGSTIGNLDPDQRPTLLAAMRAACDPDDRLLLGADLVKDTDRLLAAYDDPAGVTAAFNRNVLEVVRRELDAEVDPDDFAHAPCWNAEQDRIEMWLVARRDTVIALPADGQRWTFAAGEGLRTELSSKFRRDGLSAELTAAGFEVQRWLTDADGDFALVLAAPR
ncbi:L-histidine N(alpha)-methyltransferase [Egicoccus sp. AB-alg2]|uniref:L-histidine N(alpha)-methyltransferase n=1 Tax=Egicoccus sp. AB-alg2 TaxID=3242693 RepID=UPI00359D02E9